MDDVIWCIWCMAEISNWLALPGLFDWSNKWSPLLYCEYEGSRNKVVSVPVSSTWVMTPSSSLQCILILCWKAGSFSTLPSWEVSGNRFVVNVLSCRCWLTTVSDPSEVILGSLWYVFVVLQECWRLQCCLNPAEEENSTYNWSRVKIWYGYI